MHKRTIFERISRATHYIDGSDLVYIENPKVACSNIKWSLIREYRPEVLESINRIHDRRETPFVRQYSDIVKLLKKPAKNTFSVVRHPRKRFVSAYFDKMFEGRDQSVWNLISDFLSLDPNKVYEPKPILERLVNSSKQDLDPHVACQHTNLFWGALPFTKVFHLESLDRNDTKLSFSDFTLSVVDRQSHSTSAKVNAALFDDEAFGMIDLLYEQDYDFFNYSPESEKPIKEISVPECRSFFLDFLDDGRPIQYLKDFFEEGPQKLTPLETEAVIDRISRQSLWNKMPHRLIDFIIVRNAIQQRDNIDRFNYYYKEFPS
ncbi:sulfotransferase family 2 domain-containing protein [uncultured Cohaesibacter sp.]|uniref:sulfotransferase family 2 domain-containing protein n=1 Tax=uncultured Cohaesibacter sp. TaxID=1002546 RepID=UPI002AAB8195|nr:sulfotransferase family 2 domain-containing protein [uncultured Cohaesibacter sp.]